MENNQKEIDYNIAKSRVNSLRGFYVSLAFFIIFTSFLLIKDLIKSDFSNYNPFGKPHYILWIWGAFLVIRAVKLFIFDTRWEKEMINKELKK
jgi:hypothetical protein